MSLAVVEDIHRRMHAEVVRAGGMIEAVYYCPHGKDEHCYCRKPCPGLLLRAGIERNLSLTDAIFVGDSLSDMQAGFAANVVPVMVLTGRGEEQLRQRENMIIEPFAVMSDLYHVAKAMVQGGDDFRSLRTGEAYTRPLAAVTR
jgi:D-glycero-D-manno-heptose 1,7-bisphosphate phosphatase